MKDQKTREHYRLVFPESYRPALSMDFSDFEVEDVSEYGLKVRVDDDPAFMVNDQIEASIVFPGGREFELSAQVVRVDDGFAGLLLEAPLPATLIQSEALYVIQNFSQQAAAN